MMLFCSDYYGSHAYVSDFYPEFATQIKAALTHYETFDTGWLGVKEEIQSFRIIASKKTITVYVSASMNEDIELVEDAIFSVTQSENYDLVIRKALNYRMPITDYLDTDTGLVDALIWIAEHAPDETHSSDAIAEERFARTLKPGRVYQDIVSALDRCADNATQMLDNRFKLLEDWVRYLLLGDDKALIA